jgi:hypothetical protein
MHGNRADLAPLLGTNPKISCPFRRISADFDKTVIESMESTES